MGQLQTTSADELTNCDREQIQFSAAIQPHGLLLALREPDLRIVQCSANASVLAPRVGTLLGRSLDAVIGSDAVQALRAQLHRLAERPAEPLLLIRLPAPSPSTPRAYDVLGHRIDGLLLLEFEAVDPTAPVPDARLLHADLNAFVATLEGAGSVQQLLDAAVNHLRALTGFDRVMAYRFAADGSGAVVAEARADDLAPLLGLHYPALDIPLPARRLFTLLWLRYLPDVDYEPVPIEPPHPPGQSKPNDLTFATLRSVSLMYRRYLHNMGVRASVVTTLLKDGELWGLISCHHHGGARYLSHDQRGACALLSRTLSTLIGVKADLEVADYRAELAHAREALTRSLVPTRPLAQTLCHGTPNLLDALAADGCAVSFRGELQTAGAAPPPALLTPLFDWLAAQGGNDVFATDALGERYAPLAGHADLAAGLLAVRISPTRPDFIAWFRGEQVRDVDWAGDPANPAEREVAADGSVILSPRRSFALWREQVRGRSRAWLDCERDHARALRSAVVEVVLAQADEIDRINRELARSKDEFLAMLAHELRNPLAPIRNSVEIMRRGADADTVAQLSATISRQVQHLSRLVDDLLDVSRISTGKITLRPTAVQVHAVVQEALESVRPLLVAKQQALALDPPSEPVWLQADATRLTQMIGNLLNNAIKYTPPGGHIGLRWRQENDTLVLAVSDDGIGMAPQALEHVFELFVQDDRSIDRAQGGLGIGLALVKSLVELHGGTVQAASAGLGRGSCFTLQIPVAPVGPPLPPVADTEAAAPRRVLVVDDNADAAETLAMVLRLQGHTVKVETGAREAVAAATQFQPEVVFLDIGLPDMDGYAVARALRAQPATRAALLVALTGYGTDRDRQRARDEGFDVHLTKPADIARIQQLMSQAPALGSIG